MASIGFTSCCTQVIHHEGTPAGTFTTVGGLDTYTTGDEHGNSHVLVILTDIFGYKLNNTLLVADELARLGKYRVLIPDILNNDPFEKWVLYWFLWHRPGITTPIVDGFLSKMKQELNPKFIGAIGYCFGAKFAIPNLTETGLVDAAAVAHPSLVKESEVARITKPILISIGADDKSFSVKLRHKTEEILANKPDLQWEIKLFSGVPHGYAVRGDITIPQVKYAKEKTILDQINFFNSVSGHSFE
ncbi:hypothetical protein PSN45_004282 [Yamadazyma tenuis]|uniref:Dienelactone hydrolase n=1 Tax=Candida tenuis (strain ATCC 10573 / BCRC 21748 / CBS 615 / JCM 9827 / NBRC 10315 / NRRL Y-1498 / VKM Y-70) TaxID=590646 RepID=G3B6C9_CANTC|nr:dienelactone hydrolase [Yamadazyma tenuis ATCC 10573]EGV63436.1 dienelactone hydrolase [Yamadazyma tenuis ATCC 10573]WEJ96739.1 hypothetical protein PSN45_004282 [Yamadazyma tenuis]